VGIASIPTESKTFKTEFQDISMKKNELGQQRTGWADMGGFSSCVLSSSGFAFCDQGKV
jgi:hypothetical protein